LSLIGAFPKLIALISVKCKSYTYFRSQNKFSLQTQTSLVTAKKPRKCALSPPDQKPSNAPIFVHSSAGIHPQKEKPSGGGGLFLKKGERELEAPTQGEAMTRQEAAVGALSGRGGAKRGDVTTNRGK
jgi:hypothetical protein